MIDFIKRLLGIYDSNGLKYPVSQLNSLYPSILRMDINEQAKYVDAVTASTVGDYRFISKAIAGIEEKTGKELFYDCNATSIGNLAFLSICSPYDDIRTKTLSALKRVTTYFNLA